ncbi:hypothetical protein [Pseudomonas sp. SWRI99]|uniref:hypothetical protein n=1 Tax=Pseudomonas sp. SWRI99 TaxID=2745506 RepID=UPI001645FE84|nr:hypothetical protein [Pseudomonas sp. SWRI99]MBC3774857.1 hypothetical protein [Pseudomonas sp. SWRI99]
MSTNVSAVHASDITAILTKRFSSIDSLNLGARLTGLLGSSPSIPRRTDPAIKVETLKTTTPANTKISLIQGIQVVCNRKATHLYVSRAENTISMLDIETLAPRHTYALAHASPSPQAFSLDDGLVYMNDLHSARLWLIDTVARRVFEGALVGKGSFDLCVTPDAKYLLSCGGLAEGRLQVIDACEQQLITSVATDIYPYAVTTRHDGAYAYVVCWTERDGAAFSTVQAFDTATWQLEKSITVRGTVFDLAAHPRNQHLYLINFTRDELTVINTASYAIVKTIVVANLPETLCISPDGKHLYITSFSSIITVIDTETFQAVEIDTEKNRLHSITVSPKSGDIFVTYID